MATSKKKKSASRAKRAPKEVWITFRADTGEPQLAERTETAAKAAADSWGGERASGPYVLQKAKR